MKKFLNLLYNKSVIRFFKYITSFMLGSSIISSFPPIYFVIAAPIAIIVLSLIFLNNSSIKESLLTGFFAGTGFGGVGFYWFYYPIFYVSNSIILGVLAVLAASFIISLFFIGIACAIYFIPKKNIWLVVLYNSAIWSVAEIIRGMYLFNGMPWNIIACLWDADIYMLQTVSFVGVYGLGFITYFLCSCVLVLISNKVRYIDKTISLVLIISITSIFHFLGYYRIQVYKNIGPTDSKVVVMQPNVDQIDKNEGLNEVSIINSLLCTTDRITLTRKDLLVVWPETVISTRIINEYDHFIDRLKMVLHNNATLVAGVLRADSFGNIYNSALVFNYEKGYLKFYDKIHLVPFGEYVPVVKWLNIDNTFVSNFSFKEGEKFLDFKIGDFPLFKILICFEAIFPNRLLSNKNINLIINISNDGWYGNSVQPQQHLSLVRFRAIEGGIPMVRSVNSGISVLIDSVGNIKQYLHMFTSGYFIAKIPSIYPRPNLFAIMGNGLVFLINGFILLILFFNIIRKFLKYEIQTSENAK